MLGALTDDIAWQDSTLGPLEAKYTGKDEVLGLFGRMEEVYGGTLRLEVVDILVNDDRGVVLTREQGTEGELRTYAQMLLISAPLLINATVPRKFLEAAQGVAAQLSRALRATGEEQRQKANARLDDGVAQLREAAAPLLQVLNRAQRAAVSSEDSSA